jgi:hypothetical protein
MAIRIEDYARAAGGYNAVLGQKAQRANATGTLQKARDSYIASGHVSGGVEASHSYNDILKVMRKNQAQKVQQAALRGTGSTGMNPRELAAACQSGTINNAAGSVNNPLAGHIASMGATSLYSIPDAYPVDCGLLEPEEGPKAVEAVENAIGCRPDRDPRDQDEAPKEEQENTQEGQY